MRRRPFRPRKPLLDSTHSVGRPTRRRASVLLWRNRRAGVSAPRSVSGWGFARCVVRSRGLNQLRCMTPAALQVDRRADDALSVGHLRFSLSAPLSVSFLRRNSTWIGSDRAESPVAYCEPGRTDDGTRARGRPFRFVFVGTPRCWASPFVSCGSLQRRDRPRLLVGLLRDRIRTPGLFEEGGR